MYEEAKSRDDPMAESILIAYEKNRAAFSRKPSIPRAPTSGR
jgi:hypothetical protein